MTGLAPLSVTSPNKANRSSPSVTVRGSVVLFVVGVSVDCFSVTILGVVLVLRDVVVVEEAVLVVRDAAVVVKAVLVVSDAVVVVAAVLVVFGVVV